MNVILLINFNAYFRRRGKMIKLSSFSMHAKIADIRGCEWKWTSCSERVLTAFSQPTGYTTPNIRTSASPATWNRHSPWSMHDTGRNRTVQTPEIEDEILQHVEDTVSTNTRCIAYILGVRHSLVFECVTWPAASSFPYSARDALAPEDLPQSVQFAQWFLQQTALHPLFTAEVLYTDEA